MVPVCCLCANMQWRWRWSGVSLRYLSGCLEWFPAVFWPCGQKHSFQFDMSAPPCSQTPRETCLPVITRRTAWSSLGAIVFNRCPCSPRVKLLVSWSWRRTLRWYLKSTIQQRWISKPIRAIWNPSIRYRNLRKYNKHQCAIVVDSSGLKPKNRFNGNTTYW